MMIDLIIEAETGKKNMTLKEKVRHGFPLELNNFWFKYDHNQKFKDEIDLLSDVFWNDIFKQLYNFNNWISSLKGKKPKNFLPAYMYEYSEYVNACDELDSMKKTNDCWDYWYFYCGTQSGSLIWKRTRSLYSMCTCFKLNYLLACVLAGQNISFFEDILKGHGVRCDEQGNELKLSTYDHFNRPQMKIRDHYKEYFNGIEKRMTLPEWIKFCIECCKVIKASSKENAEARTGNGLETNYKKNCLLKNQNEEIFTLKETI